MNLSNYSTTKLIWGRSTEPSCGLMKSPKSKNKIDGENDKDDIKHIGFFLGYSIPLGEGGFEGEGIGRFVIRLIEGLLYNEKNVIITVAVDSDNFYFINKAFKKILLYFSDRLVIQRFYGVEWLNMNVPVDAWVVPYIGMGLALQLKKPIIVCLHDLVYMHFEHMYSYESGFNEEYTFIVKKLVEKATKIVFNSYFIRDNEGLKFLKLPIEKTEVIRLAAPKQEYNSISLYDEDNFRSKYKLYNDYIVYPSAVRLHKNHDRLIEGFFKFKQSDEEAGTNLNLVLTHNYKNSPKEGEIKTILNKCKDINMRNSVIFLGKLPWDDLPLLYNYAVGTIIPTLFEGSCPFQILESLTVNTPVAMSDIEVVREVISNIDEFITFDPYSTEEIKRAIGCLWKINDLEIKKQKKAISNVMKRTWLDVAREYEILIDSVLNK